MNKTIKIISTLLIAVMLVATLSQVCLAIDYDGIIDKVDTGSDADLEGIEDLKVKAANIVKALRNISAIVAVVVITVLGIKYMIGSTEERAEYKKSFIPLIVGIVVVVAAASIASALFSVAG